jgi:hypothetical protein
MQLEVFDEVADLMVLSRGGELDPQPLRTGFTPLTVCNLGPTGTTELN